MCHFCSKCTSDKLKKINERTLCFVYLDNRSSYKRLLQQCGQQTLSNQKLAMILTTVYKVVNKQNVSTSICDLLKQRENHYNLRGEVNSDIAKSKYNKLSFEVDKISGGQAMERITKWRQANNYKMFKKSILKIDLASCYI